MGKSAFKFVAAMQQVVVPSRGGQSPYVRSKVSIQTSAKLKRFQTCVGDKLRGQTHSTRADARKAFGAAASTCRGA